MALEILQLVYIDRGEKKTFPILNEVIYPQARMV